MSKKRLGKRSVGSSQTRRRSSWPPDFRIPVIEGEPVFFDVRPVKVEKLKEILNHVDIGRVVGAEMQSEIQRFIRVGLLALLLEMAEKHRKDDSVDLQLGLLLSIIEQSILEGWRLIGPFFEKIKPKLVRDFRYVLEDLYNAYCEKYPREQYNNTRQYLLLHYTWLGFTANNIRQFQHRRIERKKDFREKPKVVREDLDRLLEILPAPGDRKTREELANELKRTAQEIDEAVKKGRELGYLALVKNKAKGRVILRKERKEDRLYS